MQLILVILVVVGANTLLILNVAVAVAVQLKITDAYYMMLFFILGWYITPLPFPGLILFALVLNIVVAVAVTVLQVSGHACYQDGAGPSSF